MKINTLLTGTIIILSLMLSSNLDAQEDKLIKKARKIHDQVHTVDTHVDTPMRLFYSKTDMGIRNDARKGGGKVDFIRMREGGLDSIFFAVFIGQGKRTVEGNQKAKEHALQLFQSIHKVLKENSAIAGLALTPKDAYQLEKEGKRAIFIGMENGYPVGKDITLLKKYYELGARYVTLCHTRNNDICDSSTDKKEHGGLSEFGKKIVAEMNRLGIIIDVSHISDDSFYDVIKYTKAPVIASHSDARAICDSPRNLTDEMLKALAKNQGVIQLCLLTDYVKKIKQDPRREKVFIELRKKFQNFASLSAKEKMQVRKIWREAEKRFPKKLATVADLVDHIDHIVKVIGIDYVGIGSDFDGGGGLQDCYDVSQMQNITFELVRRGYTREQIRKIWGGNFMRVFKRVIKLKKTK
jgi:membrane dipeptidase